MLIMNKSSVPCGDLINAIAAKSRDYCLADCLVHYKTICETKVYTY